MCTVVLHENHYIFFIYRLRAKYNWKIHSYLPCLWLPCMHKGHYTTAYTSVKSNNFICSLCINKSPLAEFLHGTLLKTDLVSTAKQHMLSNNECESGHTYVHETRREILREYVLSLFKPVNKTWNLMPYDISFHVLRTLTTRLAGSISVLQWTYD